MQLVAIKNDYLDLSDPGGVSLKRLLVDSKKQKKMKKQ